MYKPGDQVVYGNHGVCTVAQLQEVTVDKARIVYLVLTPVSQDGSRYMIPVNCESAMAKLSPLLTPEQLDQLLHSPEVRKDGWISAVNLRKETYRMILSSSDRAAVLRMLAALRHHREQRLAEGKRMHQSDENFLREAEKRITGEISVIMNMDPEQARDYLWENLRPV